MSENHTTFMRRWSHLNLHARQLIELAYILSKDAHRSQRRMTGERYFEHPRGVALILFDELRVHEPWLNIVALLHDIVEDTKYIDVPFIERFFGVEIADAVGYLTKDQGMTKGEYWARLDTASSKVVLVKACDRLHNLRSLPGTNPSFQRKQAKETREKLLPLIDKHLRKGEGAIVDLALIRRLLTTELELLDQGPR